MKRQEQKLKTRQHILNVAYQRFAEQGIESTNTADIAKHAELSHGAIFVHFKTRQDIVLAVIERFGAALRERVYLCAEGEHTTESLLLAFIDSLTEFEDFYSELLLVLPKLPEAVQGSILIVQNALAYPLLPLLRKSIGSERFDQLGESTLMNTWFALLHYYLGNRSWFAPEGSVLKQRGERIVQEYLNLIKIAK
jgi:AcrR family transcriptional regulator